jgi:hypothetical protein
MIRIASTTLFVTALSLALGGCVRRSKSDVSNQRSSDQVGTEAAQTLDLVRQADLVIDYERSDSIQLWVPGRTSPISATERTLALTMATVTAKRRLAVVFIGKPVRHEFPEPQLRAKVDSIEAVVRAQGFARVTFKLASSSGYHSYGP